MGFVIVPISCDMKNKCNNVCNRPSTLLVHSECKRNELFYKFYCSLEFFVSSGSIPSQENMEVMIYTDSGSCAGMMSAKLNMGLPGVRKRVKFLFFSICISGK